MKINRDVYRKDPGQVDLLNNGVARVSESTSAEERRTLRFELETFVCEGEYERGLERVLNAFLSHLQQPEQPGVWVSGFFGSGKSHFVKMLRALWVDTSFSEDNATARGLAHLPQEIKDALIELSTAGKREGGLHAASGTLGAGAGTNIRPALLAMVFRSVDLPASYPQARFVLWLEKEGHFETIRNAVEKSGAGWQAELSQMYMSRPIAEALVEHIPNFAGSPQDARALLREQYRNTDDVTNEQMVEAIRQALLSRYPRFPLTLIALDEVQQFIGEDADRTYQVQEAVETCCKAFGGKLMFVGTGQTALAGTPSLQRLMGRFQIRVELSDTDVDAVVRKVILAKKPEAVQVLKKLTEEHMGEISRHLNGSKLGHQPEDLQHLVADYPLLPVRRRFWERVLRSVDPTGTKSQLRNQINVVHQAARATANADLGNVVAGDFIYHEIATDLLQTGMLPRQTYERIQALKAGDEDERLQARLCALIYLIGTLPQNSGEPHGVRATEQTLADLLVEDLRQGSGALRRKIPPLLQHLVEQGYVMRIDDEYRIQTAEGAAWSDEYRRQYNAIQNNAQLLANERSELFRREIRMCLNEIRIQQGKAKEPRRPEPHFGAEPPPAQENNIFVWVQDGWDTDEKSMLAEVRAAGNQSPLIFVFLRRHAAEDLKTALVGLRAAEATLNARGIPNTPEGQEARNAMETRKTSAEQKLRQALAAILDEAMVYQAGGQEVTGASLTGKVEEAMHNALARLFPEFDRADHDQWGKVIERAKAGAGDALSVLGYTGDAENHEVCKALLQFVGAGKKGLEIRQHFTASPYGWPQDAIDAGLYVLACSEHLRVTDAQGQRVDMRKLPQGQIGRQHFKVESVTVSAAQKIHVRKVLQEAGLPARAGEELAGAGELLTTLRELAEAAGGEPPLPQRPDFRMLLELENLHGNELLAGIAERHDELVRQVREWRHAKEEIERRLPRWQNLLDLLQQANELPGLDHFRQQIQAIRDQRLLLEDPDPVPPLCAALTNALRAEWQQRRKAYEQTLLRERNALEADPIWQELAAKQRQELLLQYDLEATPEVATGTEHEVLAALKAMPLPAWRDRCEALPNRFGQLRLAAAQLLAPAARRVTLPSRTLRTPEEAEAWLAEVRALLEKGLQDGPVVV